MPPNKQKSGAHSASERDFKGWGRRINMQKKA